jgi:hypothetical protein
MCCPKVWCASGITAGWPTGDGAICAALCRALLGAEPEAPDGDSPPPARRCPLCGGPVAVVETISRATFHVRSRAEDVNSTRRSGSLLLAGQAGPGRLERRGVPARRSRHRIGSVRHPKGFEAEDLVSAAHPSNGMPADIPGHPQYQNTIPTYAVSAASAASASGSLQTALSKVMRQ